MAVNCNKLRGVRKKICTGEIEVSEEKRRAFVKIWKRRGYFKHGISVHDPKGEKMSKKKSPKLLGDKIAGALRAIGITESLVKKWTGKNCKCSQRKEWLNIKDLETRKKVKAIFKKFGKH